MSAPAFRNSLPSAAASYAGNTRKLLLEEQTRSLVALNDER